MKLLMKVTEVMKDAYVILDKPETGATAIAAETEAIELLLEARHRPPGGGGGGGGSNPGGGGGAASASSSALANIGPGSDASATIGERAAGQATGKAGRELPEEFEQDSMPVQRTGGWEEDEGSIRRWSVVIRSSAGVRCLCAGRLGMLRPEEPNVPFIDQTLQRSDEFLQRHEVAGGRCGEGRGHDG